MDVIDMMLDPTVCELDRLRRQGEAEESKHDCKGCTKRVGIPCLIAKSCTRLKGAEHE